MAEYYWYYWFSPFVAERDWEQPLEYSSRERGILNLTFRMAVQIYACQVVLPAGRQRKLRCLICST